MREHGQTRGQIPARGQLPLADGHLPSSGPPVTNLGELYGETLKVAAVFLDMNLNVAVALPKHL